MHTFPGEQECSGEVQEHLADLFSLAESLFNYWTDQERGRWTEQIPLQSANLALILDVQACRLFRSVVEDCRRVEAYTASILARTLFETLLGVAFLLKKDVRIIVEPTKKGNPPGVPPSRYCAKLQSKGHKRTPRHRLTREFRASLFLAYHYFWLEQRGIPSIGIFPGLFHAAKRLQKSSDPAIVAQYEKEIGPKWSYILRNSDTYAGLSVKDLAKVLHKEFARWYETVYPFQSCDVHALDFLQHVRLSKESTLSAAFLSPVEQVYQSLRAAVGLFFAHMYLVHENIGFGTAADIAFHSLRRKYDQLKGMEA